MSIVYVLTEKMLEKMFLFICPCNPIKLYAIDNPPPNYRCYKCDHKVQISKDPISHTHFKQSHPYFRIKPIVWYKSNDITTHTLYKVIVPSTNLLTEN